MTSSKKSAPKRSRARSAARLAAVQALYQQEMEGTPTPILLHEFHNHRFGQTIDDVTMIDAEMDFFDDIVRGVTARQEVVHRIKRPEHQQRERSKPHHRQQPLLAKRSQTSVHMRSESTTACQAIGTKAMPEPLGAT